MDAVMEMAAVLAGVPFVPGSLEQFYQRYDKARTENPGPVSEAIAVRRTEVVRKTKPVPFKDLEPRITEWLKAKGAPNAQMANRLTRFVGASSISEAVLTLHSSPVSQAEWTLTLSNTAAKLIPVRDNGARLQASKLYGTLLRTADPAQGDPQSVLVRCVGCGAQVRDLAPTFDLLGGGKYVVHTFTCFGCSKRNHHVPVNPEIPNVQVNTLRWQDPTANAARKELRKQPSEKDKKNAQQAAWRKAQAEDEKQRRADKENANQRKRRAPENESPTKRARRLRVAKEYREKKKAEAAAQAGS
jgi:hypothetical protein